MIRKIVALVMVLCLAVMTAAPVHAAGSITAESAVTVQFPMSIVFQVSAKSGATITDIRLHYAMEELGFADVTAEAFVTFAPSTQVNASWTWQMVQSGGLPPGAVVSYWWTLKDSGGAMLTTPEQRVTFDDSRFTWQSVAANKLTIYWYDGDEAFGKEILATAQDAVERLSEDTGAYLKEPVRFYIYASSADLKGSMIFPQEWTGGVSFTRYGCIAIGISTANLTWGKRAIAHELTHMVTHQMTLNPYNDIPVWLEEGLAMWNEGPMQSQFSSALARAISDKKLLSVQTLASPFSAYADVSYLSYAESYSVVDYLIRTYGKDRMFQLLETFHQGSTYDGALRKVYGLDTKSLNAEWQKTLGMAPKVSENVPRLVALALGGLTW